MSHVQRCPKWQYVSLTKQNGDEYIVRSRCKSWECPVCRKQKYNEIRTMMEYGTLMVGRCYLITVTRKEGNLEANRASCVNRDFSELLKMLKVLRPQNRQMKWYKVVELTKKDTPHLHLIVGGIGARKDNCVPKKGKQKRYSRKWLRKKCDCVAHEWAKAWDVITKGASFIVDVEEVYSPGGAVAYLVKYLMKGFKQRWLLKELGFERRFACSRNWPREPKMQLEGSKTGWKRIERLGQWDEYDNKKNKLKESEGREMMRIERTELGDSIRFNRIKKAKIIAMEKKIGGLNVTSN